MHAGNYNDVSLTGAIGCLPLVVLNGRNNARIIASTPAFGLLLRSARPCTVLRRGGMERARARKTPTGI